MINDISTSNSRRILHIPSLAPADSHLRSDRRVAEKKKSVAGPQQVLRYSNSSTVAKVELYSSRHRYLELVRDQDDGLSPQPALDALLKDVLAHVDVHSRERVV